ncbi:hypothetical protein GCM10022202_27760 [Microbacterium marinilacus]|uniref:Uncharacterized protein n=1 Tax=Microbacterium marinilacus TaxID=415209 RepID=A0ABP7BLA7_9MICO
MLVRRVTGKVRWQCYRPWPDAVGSRAFPPDERPQPLPDAHLEARADPGRMRGNVGNMREIVNSRPTPTPLRIDARVSLVPSREAPDRRGLR